MWRFYEVQSSVRALLLTSLAGCANQAVVTLQDGSEVLVKDQSDYDKYNDYYEFEQLNGDTILIKKDNVRTIRPQ
ncbi:YgdI/YgdR family lipoprotein [Pseudomonas aeruginosa]|uniref:YgdI/YgdR family lipoprotein n=1 Tax=Pseudomonas aeruginosa TaxID=287 RepID=UPI001FCA42FD|nr:YgdI/YgdR family lipoprotein [Pseudomonas aeruginosa]